jgi:drug/metabolite transporter (DMT)-like permease
MIKKIFNKKLIIAYISVIFAMLFWGLSFIWTKIILQYYHPITTLTLRLLISSVLIFIIVLISRQLKFMRKEDIKWLLLLSLFEPLCYYLFEGYGLRLVSSTIASLIISTIPVFTPYIVFLLYKHKISLYNKIGLAISFIGVFVMITEKQFTLSASPLGVLFLFGAVFSSIFYTIILKKLSHKYNIMNIILWQNIVGFIYFLPLFFINDYHHFITVKLTEELVINLIFLSIFASSIAFMLYAIAVRDLGVPKTNLFINTIPVFTAIFSYLILSELFSIHKILGIIIVLIGIILSELTNIRKIYKS